MTTTTDYGRVYALENGLGCVKAVVVDDRPWRYLQRKRGDLYSEHLRPIQQSDRPDSGILVLRRSFSSIIGQPDDDILITLAAQIRDSDALEHAKRARHWPAWVEATLAAHKLEIVVRPAVRLQGDWATYEQREAERDVIHEAEGIAAEVVEAEQEAEHTRLVSDVERRLLRAGVTFTTDPKPPHDVRRHDVTGDAMNALGKVMTEADVHEDCYGTGVVMSYGTLLRLLEQIR